MGPILRDLLPKDIIPHPTRPPSMTEADALPPLSVDTVVLDSVPSLGASDSLPLPPIGGRLQSFYHHWELYNRHLASLHSLPRPHFGVHLHPPEPIHSVSIVRQSSEDAPHGPQVSTPVEHRGHRASSGRSGRDWVLFNIVPSAQEFRRAGGEFSI